MTKINIINDLIRVCPFNENEPMLEVDDETLHKIMRNEIIAKGGKLVDNTKRLEAQRKITELKRNLADTDFKVIKKSEGYYTEEEYAPIKAQRQVWRDEINELEKQLEK